MNPTETSIAAGDAINEFASHFMIDMATYVRGAELGYEGVDFYVAGRAGVLGDVPASAVVDAFVHFEPGTIEAAWARTSGHPRATSAQEFADVGHEWAEAKIPDSFDSARLAELAGKVGDAAAAAIDPAVVPLFTGWRALPEPGADHPKALCLHRMNALRELRGALHGAAVRANEIDSQHAVAHRTPYMLGIFGWDAENTEVPPHVPARWDAAQAACEEAMSVAFAPLTEAERAEFVELANAAQAAIVAG